VRFRPIVWRCGARSPWYDGLPSAMNHEVPRIEELIARARSGDQAALDQLFQWCRPLLMERAALRLAKKRPGIERPSDIVQKAALKAFRAFPDFEGTTFAEWLSWLDRIVQTCTIQSFRDARRKKRDKAGEAPLDEDEIPSHQLSPSQATATEEEWQQLWTQIYLLQEEQRTAILLRHFKELRVAEVARRMGKTEAAVAGLLQRGLRTLRDRLTSALAPTSPTADPHRITQAQEEAATMLLVYLRRRDAGERVEPEAFIAEHPSCAEELRHALEWIERIQALRPTEPVE